MFVFLRKNRKARYVKFWNIFSSNTCFLAAVVVMQSYDHVFMLIESLGIGRVQKTLGSQFF